MKQSITNFKRYEINETSLVKGGDFIKTRMWNECEERWDIILYDNVTGDCYNIIGNLVNPDHYNG